MDGVRAWIGDFRGHITKLLTTAVCEDSGSHLDQRLNSNASKTSGQTYTFDKIVIKLPG